MFSFNIILSITVALTSVSKTLAAPSKHCKVVPGDHDWPSFKSWSSLNNTIEGRLIDPTPVFAVCHPSRPVYDKAACKIARKKADLSAFRAAHPIGTHYNDQGCLPNTRYPCEYDNYPVYVVNATRPAHVKHAVDFARDHNIRLVVKGTGHDWNIRSTGRHSLSIWTHHMKIFEVHDNFKPSGCDDCDTFPAATIGAGYQMKELISELGKYGRVAVGGGDPDVGIGGFLSAGGHSPLSFLYGLGADQILEMDVVTAAGEILTINQQCHSDLFWAVRGGGPSHAIMTSVTLKTFPTSSSTQINWNVNASTPTHFWDFVTFLHTQLPDILDNGVMGYYYPINLGDAGGQISGNWQAHNKTDDEIKTILRKFETHAKEAPGIKYKSFKQNFKAYAGYYASVVPQTVGSFGRLSSRLIGREALTSNSTKLKQDLMKAAPPGVVFIGHLVAGKGVADAIPAGGSDSVLPAWRKAYVHIIAGRAWKPFDPEMEHKRWNDLTNVRVKALTELDPDSGSYVSEGDPHEPDWQHTFWGANYARLFKIKNKWDPHGVFYCSPCVGAEQWQHVNGTLCRVTGNT